VLAVLTKLKPDWMGHTYNLLRKNCCFFSHEFAIELGVGAIPEWVYSLADIGAWTNQFVLRKETPDKTEPRASFRKTWRSVEENHDGSHPHNFIGDMTLAHVMAVRLQRKYRTRRDEKGMAEAGVRRASRGLYDGEGFELI